MAGGARRKKLIDGLRLLLLHPEVPTCADCQTWRYDREWRKVERPRGKPLKRVPGETTPCFDCPKAAGGKPNPGAELSAKNWLAYDYYRQCLADPTQLLPRDLVVVQNNALLGAAEETLRRQGGELSVARLLGAALGGGGGRAKSHR